MKTIVAQRAEANIKAVVKYWANLSEKPWLFLLGIIRDKIPENKKPIIGRKIVSLASMKIDKKLKKFLIKKNLFSLFYNRIYFWQIFICINFVDKNLGFRLIAWKRFNFDICDGFLVFLIFYPSCPIINFLKMINKL